MAAGPDIEPVVHTDEHLIAELTTRAIAEIYPSREAFQDELRSGRRLTAYMGIDPTAPDIHVGHESQLLKLQRLQAMGHQVILLIGDFTAMIGDPTDKSAARTRLTKDEVLANAEGYKEQAGKILDFDDPINPIDLRYNSEWLGDMDFGDVLELASEFTVQQMLQRNSFQKRMEAGNPVSMVEFMYPMMQGWDSVALGVDIEVGGSDQIFNMLQGSTLVRRHLDKPKFVIAGQLLVDPSGKKIGKTEGNMITMNDQPGDMYHRIMMWGDEITPHALELCSQLPMVQVEEIAEKLESGELSGLEGKMFLARTIVTDLHDAEAAAQAEEDYRSVVSKQQEELNIDTLAAFATRPDQEIVDILVESGLAPSRSQARRLLEGNGVRVNGEKITADWKMPTVGNDQSLVLQVGKKKRENHRVLTSSSQEES